MTEGNTPTAAALVEAAKAVAPCLPLDKARDTLAQDGAVFVDVRDSNEFGNGVIPGAHHVPRGSLEFALDRSSDLSDPVLTGANHLVMVCGSGGRAALASELAQRMGYRVSWLEGGMKGWNSL